MADTPSTAPTPLDESLKKFLGGEGAAPLSQNQVTYGSNLPGGDIGYDPNNQFRPQGDILTINAAPGTGATTAETWAHELDVERQKQDALEFEFQQRQQAEENARHLAELEMQKAEAARAAALGDPQLEAAKLSNVAAKQQLTAGQQSMEIARAGEERAAREAYTKYPYSVAEMKAQYQSLADQNRYQAGAAIDDRSVAAYQQLLANPGYIKTGTYVPNLGTSTQPMIYRYNAGGSGYVPAPVYQPPIGINGRPTQQIYNTPYVAPQPVVSGKLWK